MKLLDGRDLAGFIQERHSRIMSGLEHVPQLAIVCVKPSEATLRYLRVKRQYGEGIGVPVHVFEESAATVIERVNNLNRDASITGIIVQLPLPGPELTAEVLSAIAPAKDIDGLRTGSMYEAATPKAIMWLLAGHNVDLKGRHIAVVGQGRLVGRPLADALEASGYSVTRCDIDTADLEVQVQRANVIISATGQAGLITSRMLGEGAVVVDAGSPHSELSADALERTDLIRTSNPGGVGPMTVAALFDNLMIAAQRN